MYTIGILLVTTVVIFSGCLTGGATIIFSLAYPNDPGITSHYIQGLFWFIVNNLIYFVLLMGIRKDIWWVHLSEKQLRLVIFRLRYTAGALQFFALIGTFFATIMWFLYPENPRLEPLTVLFGGYTATIIYTHNRLLNAISEYRPDRETQ